MSTKSKSQASIADILRRAFGGPTVLNEPRPLEQLILLVLARGTDIKKAQAVMEQLQAEYVDWNEVRVTSAYELRKHISVVSEPGPGDKSDQLKDLLTTIFNRFNKLNLDFLLPGSSDTDGAKKRDRFQNYLADRFPAIAAILSLYGGLPTDLAITPSLTRVMQRLGLLPGKSSGIQATREALLANFEADGLLTAQWGLHHVAESTCLSRAPLCTECVLFKLCPTAKAGAAERSEGDESPKEKKSSKSDPKTPKARASR